MSRRRSSTSTRAWQRRKTALTRLRQLFQHAGNVADLATVENEIAQREADLESLEAQQRTFAAQTAQATITVNLVATPKVAVVPPPVKKAHVVGFVRGLRGGWHAFTRTVTGITTALGALLPFLGRAARTRHRRTDRAAPAIHTARR